MVMELSKPVNAAVEEAVKMVESVVEEIYEKDGKQKADR